MNRCQAHIATCIAVSRTLPLPNTAPRPHCTPSSKLCSSTQGLSKLAADLFLTQSLHPMTSNASSSAPLAGACVRGMRMFVCGYGCARDVWSRDRKPKPQLRTHNTGESKEPLCVKLSAQHHCHRCHTGTGSLGLNPHERNTRVSHVGGGLFTHNDRRMHIINRRRIYINSRRVFVDYLEHER